MRTSNRRRGMKEADPSTQSRSGIPWTRSVDQYQAVSRRRAHQAVDSAPADLDSPAVLPAAEVAGAEEEVGDSPVGESP